MAKRKKYEDYLLDQLRDAKYASEYLNAHLEDGDLDLFFLAVRNVVKANKPIKDVAEEVGLNRESMYKSLSERGNPRIKNFIEIIRCVGIDFNFKPKHPNQ